jgi:hypothetical protein
MAEVRTAWARQKEQGYGDGDPHANAEEFGRNPGDDAKDDDQGQADSHGRMGSFRSVGRRVGNCQFVWNGAWMEGMCLPSHDD